MSVHTPARRVTTLDIRARKGVDPVVCLTAYDAPTAVILDRHCDILLVGDSLGPVVHGLDSTVGVTLEMMILQGRAVMRGSSRALVVVDMPFGSYEENPEQAFRNGARVLKETGAGAIKHLAAPLTTPGLTRTVELRSGASSAVGMRYVASRSFR